MAAAVRQLELRCDRLTVLSGLLIVTVVAAGYIVWFALNMTMAAETSSSDRMAGMDMVSHSSSTGIAGMTKGPDGYGGGMAGTDIGETASDNNVSNAP